MVTLKIPQKIKNARDGRNFSRKKFAGSPAAESLTSMPSGERSDKQKRDSFQILPIILFGRTDPVYLIDAVDDHADRHHGEQQPHQGFQRIQRFFPEA